MIAPHRLPHRRGLRPWQRHWLLAALGLLLACAFVAWQSVKTSRGLWNGPTHDRQTHYLFASQIAHAARSLDLRELFVRLWQPRLYPPLHAALVSGTLLVGGAHYQLAFWPSWAGYLLAAIAAFGLVRRGCPGAGGTFGGALASALILASPAMRAYAGDIMLESLGAGLSLLAILAGAHVFQAPAQLHRWRWLAWSLTGLFFLKYNYWVLVVLTLLLETAWQLGWGGIRRFAQKLSASLPRPGLFLWAAGGVLILTLVVSLSGQRLPGLSPWTLVWISYLLVLAYLVWHYPRMLQKTDPALHMLLKWHLAPVALWFALPKRLGQFLWFISPANREGTDEGLISGMRFYWQKVQEDYWGHSQLFWLVLLLAAVALLGRRRMSAGLRLSSLFLIVGIWMTCRHPNHQSRYVHSWIAALSVCAGAGAGWLIYLTPRRIQVYLAMGSAAALALPMLALWKLPPRAEEPGHRQETASLLDLTDAYLPSLAPYQRVMILAPSGRYLLEWTYRDVYRRPVDVPWWDGHVSADEVRSDLARRWEKKTPQAVVLIPAPPRSELNSFEGSGYIDPNVAFAGVTALLQRHGFARHRSVALPRQDYSLEIWTPAGR